MQLMLHVRIDPLDQMENLGQFFVDQRIDKPWGNTLREKLHEPCACGIQIGDRQLEPQGDLSSFWTNPNFIIAYTLVFLSVSLKAGGKSQTPNLDFEKSIIHFDKFQKIGNKMIEEPRHGTSTTSTSTTSRFTLQWQVLTFVSGPASAIESPLPKSKR